MTEFEVSQKIDLILSQSITTGQMIVVTKHDPPEYFEGISGALYHKLIESTGSGLYRITDEGRKAHELGGVDEWKSTRIKMRMKQ